MRIKRLDDRISIPCNDEWHQRKVDMVELAIREKFSRNRDLLEKLRGTGHNILVEATPDSFWGAGVPLTLSLVFL